MKQETDIERAYRSGLAAALRQSISIVKNPIEAPIYDAIYNKYHAKRMTQSFLDGVNEWRNKHKSMIGDGRLASRLSAIMPKPRRRKMTYQGWKNWETWNVALWCDNEEAIYKDRIRRKPRTIDDVQEFVREWFPDGTPDMRGEEDDAFIRDARAVDWQELVEHWEEDYAS